MPVSHWQRKCQEVRSENTSEGKKGGDRLMPDHPKQWANSRNEELGLVSSYVNNGTDGCVWVLNQIRATEGGASGWNRPSEPGPGHGSPSALKNWFITKFYVGSFLKSVPPKCRVLPGFIFRYLYEIHLQFTVENSGIKILLVTSFFFFSIKT